MLGGVFHPVGRCRMGIKKAGLARAVAQERFLAPERVQKYGESQRIPASLGRDFLPDFVGLAFLRPAVGRKYEALCKITDATHDIPDDRNKEAGHAGDKIGDEGKRPLARNSLNGMAGGDVADLEK